MAISLDGKWHYHLIQRFSVSMKNVEKIVLTSMLVAFKVGVEWTMVIQFMFTFLTVIFQKCIIALISIFLKSIKT